VAVGSDCLADWPDCSSASIVVAAAVVAAAESCSVAVVAVSC